MLTPKKRLFAERYIVHKNGARAAREAGYAVKNARAQAVDLLADPDVAKLIADAARKLTLKNQAEAERTLRDVMRIARSDVRRCFDSDGKPLPVHELPDDVALAVNGWDSDVESTENQDGDKVIRSKTKIKLWDKPAALRMLMQHFKLLDSDSEKGHASVTVVVNTLAPRKKP